MLGCRSSGQWIGGREGGSEGGREGGEEGHPTDLVGKMANDPASEEAKDGDPVQLHLPPLLAPPLHDVPDGDTQIGARACQVGGADNGAAGEARGGGREGGREGER